MLETERIKTENEARNLDDTDFLAYKTGLLDGKCYFEKKKLTAESTIAGKKLILNYNSSSDLSILDKNYRASKNTVLKTYYKNSSIKKRNQNLKQLKTNYSMKRKKIVNSAKKENQYYSYAEIRLDIEMSAGYRILEKNLTLNYYTDWFDVKLSQCLDEQCVATVNGQKDAFLTETVEILKQENDNYKNAVTQLNSLYPVNSKKFSETFDID